jgi:hypothetical protein
MTTDLATRYGVNPVNDVIDTTPAASHAASNDEAGLPTLDVEFVWHETIDERVVGVYTGTAVLSAPRSHPAQYRIAEILVDECVDESDTPVLIDVPPEHRIFAPIALFLLSDQREYLDGCWADHLIDLGIATHNDAAGAGVAL